VLGRTYTEVIKIRNRGSAYPETGVRIARPILTSSQAANQRTTVDSYRASNSHVVRLILLEIRYRYSRFRIECEQLELDGAVRWRSNSRRIFTRISGPRAPPAAAAAADPVTRLLCIVSPSNQADVFMPAQISPTGHRFRIRSPAWPPFRSRAGKRSRIGRRRRGGNEGRGRADGKKWKDRRELILQATCGDVAFSSSSSDLARASQSSAY